MSSLARASSRAAAASPEKWAISADSGVAAPSYTPSKAEGPLTAEKWATSTPAACLPSAFALSFAGAAADEDEDEDDARVPPAADSSATAGSRTGSALAALVV